MDGLVALLASAVPRNKLAKLKRSEYEACGVAIRSNRVSHWAR